MEDAKEWSAAMGVEALTAGAEFFLGVEGTEGTGGGGCEEVI